MITIKSICCEGNVLPDGEKKILFCDICQKELGTNIYDPEKINYKNDNESAL